MLRKLNIEPLVSEINYTLREILHAKGYAFADMGTGDFLNLSPLQGCAPDRIIQNPPFENGQDISHCLHAYEVLKEGGRLVSIVSSGPFYRQDKKSVEFRQWLNNENADVIDLPDGSFDGAGAFRSTGVSCKIVVMNK